MTVRIDEHVIDLRVARESGEGQRHFGGPARQGPQYDRERRHHQRRRPFPAGGGNPTGTTVPPSTTLTATDPVPAMKKRIEG